MEMNGVLANVYDEDAQALRVSGYGGELGYAEITSVVTGLTGVGAANRADLSPPLSVTVTVGTRPITVEASFTSGSSDTADRGGGIAIVEGTTILAQSQGHSSFANLGFPIKAKIRLEPSEGEHTYKVMGYALVGGTFTPLVGSSSPAFIQVIEV